MSSIEKHAPHIPTGISDILASARQAALVLAANAAEVDECGHFPEAGLQALKRSGLMGLIIPRQYGGCGASYETMVQVAQILAASCLSTGMIWAMHCQQVAVIVDHASDMLKRRVLPRIAAGEMFIASVTSEKEKGGHLLSAYAPLIWDGEEIALVRDAPVVTGGAFGDGYLITMRAGEDTPPSEVALVFADRSQLHVDIRAGWHSMGVRGTHSVGMALKGSLPKDQVIGPIGGFKHLAVQTMIPVGHIAWSASWIGAAQGALDQMLEIFRDTKLRAGYNMQSDLFAERLARARMQIDVARVYLTWLVQEYEKIRGDGKFDVAKCEAPWFNIHVNNLKILASELSFEAIDRLVQLAGLRYGYLKNSRVNLERTFRDLRSSTLMYSNDRLLVANGKLTLIDRDDLI